ELGRAEDLIRSPLWERPGFIAVAFFVSAIATLVYLWMPGATPVTAASLLERARVAEDKIDHNPDLVQHRMVVLEERQPTDRRMISRHRIEDWRGAAHGLKVRRLYDDKNRLIAGEWRKTDGGSTLYRNRKSKTVGKRAIPDSPPAIPNPEIWQFELSAKEFSTLIKEASIATVEETAQTYVIRYQPATESLVMPTAELTKGSITLSKHDLHTIEQTLLIRQASETSEFRFSESSYEQLPLDQVSPSVFEPERELVASSGEIRRKGNAITASSSPDLLPSP